VVDWFNPKTGESVTLQSDLGNGEASMLNTYADHTFAIHEPGNESYILETCKVQYITITENKQQTAVTKHGLVVEQEENESRYLKEAADIGIYCKEEDKGRI